MRALSSLVPGYHVDFLTHPSMLCQVRSLNIGAFHRVAPFNLQFNAIEPSCITTTLPVTA